MNDTHSLLKLRSGLGIYSLIQTGKKKKNHYWIIATHEDQETQFQEYIIKVHIENWPHNLQGPGESENAGENEPPHSEIKNFKKVMEER